MIGAGTDAQRDVNVACVTRPALQRAEKSIFVGLCASLFFGALAIAEAAPLKVLVDDRTYLVNGAVIVAEKDIGPLDGVTIRKASFTAQVLEDQILNSEFTRQLFNSTSRATLFADQASGRFVQPWRRQLLKNSPTRVVAAGGDPELVAAKEAFKAWTAMLAGNPAELALAIARKDYLDGIYAYQENAAIYRKVTMRKEVLNYDDARQFLQNQMATRRLVAARELERRVSGSEAAAHPIDAATLDQTSTRRLGQRFQTEVIDRIDSDVKTVADLERNFEKLKKIAESESSQLQSYRDAIKPSVVRFIEVDPKAANSALPQASRDSLTTKLAGQSTVSITVPTRTSLLNTPGGVLPSSNPAGKALSVSVDQPTGNSLNPSNTNLGSDAGTAPGVGTGQNERLSALGDSSTAADMNSVVAGNSDNLKTYSSNPYHSSDGWVFSPTNGLWVNPDDPTETRIPSVITCCDDTGLAFPNEAVEAQQNFWGDGSGAGSDPNCGRLYSCNEGGRPIIVDTGGGPTDNDGKFLAVLAYIDSLRVDQANAFLDQFLKDLPSSYRLRFFQLARQHHNASPPRTNAGATERRSASSANNSSPARFTGGSPTNNSTITGLGGVSSSYEPVTKIAAQSIVSKYPVVPTCK